MWHVRTILTVEPKICSVNKVKPLNIGHAGTKSFVLYREMFFIWRLKCTGQIGIGMGSFVFYRKLSYIYLERPLSEVPL